MMCDLEFDEYNLVELIIGAYEFKVCGTKVAKMLQQEGSNLVTNMCLELSGAMRAMEAIEKEYGIIIDAEDMTFIEMCEYQFIKKTIQEELVRRKKQAIK